MRALSTAWILCFALAAACGSTVDVCDDVTGTCVSLRVESPTITSIDSLHIVSVGAIGGTKDTPPGPATDLPLHVALRLPDTAMGAWHLQIDGRLAGAVLGSCMTDVNVVVGAHTTATCVLLGGSADLGDGGNLPSDGGLDLGGDAGDGGILPVVCDPKGVSGPQCVWRWQTPLPQGSDIHGVVAVGDADTYALTADNLILHRDASSWSLMATRPTPPSTGFFFQTVSISGGGATNDFFVGATYTPVSTSVPLVYRSPDKGATWSQETLPVGAAGNLYAGASEGGSAIFPGDSGKIYVRDATLNTWSAKTSGANTFTGAALHGLNALVYGFNSSAYAAYSTTAGAAWSAASVTPSNFVPQGACIGAGTPASFWIVGGPVVVHAAGPTPSAFTQQSGIPNTENLSGCVATDATHAWAFGDAGTVYFTTDGASWNPVAAAPVTTSALTAGVHSSGTALTLVGTRGAIFRSTNEGASFTGEETGPTDPITTIYGVAPGTVFAVGPAANIIRTADDGKTWTKLAVPLATGTTANLQAVWGSSATDVYAVGAGVAVHSSDGMSFAKASGILGTDYLYDVWGTATLGAYAVGTSAVSSGNRVVYRSTDHGVSFTPLTISGFTGLPGVAFTVFAIGSDVWIGDEKGDIYHSGDGTTFTAQTSGVAAGIIKIRGIAGDIFALLGTDPGSYVHTTNGGNSWVNVASAFNDTGTEIAFQPDESAIYVFNSGTTTLYSTDHGANWLPFQPDILTTSNNIMRSAFAFAPNDVFVHLDTGIIHYGN